MTLRVKSPNSGCLINIEIGPQSGPPLYNKAKGRKAAHQFIMELKAATRPITFNATKGRKVAHYWIERLYPVFGKYPEFGEFI